jgi:hypothetical protein
MMLSGELEKVKDNVTQVTSEVRSRRETMLTDRQRYAHVWRSSMQRDAKKHAVWSCFGEMIIHFYTVAVPFNVLSRHSPGEVKIW